MALRDHFAEGSYTALAEIRDIIKERGSSASDAQVVNEIADVASRADPQVDSDDDWTLQYISLLRVQHLIEAMDADVSSFVTVSEINAFTSERPLEWR
jgi:hypothetical protein